MSRLINLLQQALVCHQQGRLQEALNHYQQVLSIDPMNFDALWGVGMLYGQSGHFKEALLCFSGACMVSPNDFSAHLNRGIALQELKRHEEALRSYDRALSLKPNLSQIHLSRGNVLEELCHYDEALACYTRAIAFEPASAKAYNNRGVILERLQHNDEALVSYEKALALNPALVRAHVNHGALLEKSCRYEQALASYNAAVSSKPSEAEAYFGRGNALRALHRYDEALSDYERALALSPGFAEAYNNLGALLAALRCYHEALKNFDRTLALEPDHADAHFSRGNVLKELNRHDEALAAYDKAVTLKPDYAEAYNNRGNVLKECHRHAEASVEYDRAISLRPDYADALYNKSLLKLLLGDYDQGWRLHEWRWKTAFSKDSLRGCDVPLWSGDRPVAGKTLLLTAEQGRGDVIQFARYAPMAAALGANVILRVPAGLVTLMSTLKGNFSLIAHDDPFPPCDLFCPLMSLPLAFKTTVGTIPSQVPYLSADPQRRGRWRRRLGPKMKPRIGLAWSGNPGHINDSNRGMPLRALAPLLELDFEYHSLQPETRTEDQAALAAFDRLRTHQDELHDFADTAALIAGLDLVISVDTAAAHLAGALGKPVWIMLPYDPDFRWMLSRSDSPWYPTVRLFRQGSRGDWKGVMKNVRSELWSERSKLKQK